MLYHYGDFSLARSWPGRALRRLAAVSLLFGLGWQQSAFAFEFTPLVDDLPYGVSGGLTLNPKDHYVYGTFLLGGRHNKGGLFKLKFPARGEAYWTIGDVRDVASFSGKNGEYPDSGVIADAAGNLYGTASQGGGKNVDGVVFQITHEDGKKVRKLLKKFDNTIDGYFPFPKLVLDAAGNLYGVTRYGGQYGAGVVFQLTPPAVGQTAWGFQVLVNFDVANGASPEAGLVLGSNGKLYGTTAGGGTHKFGTVFELTPPAVGQTTWGFQTVVNFDDENGANPVSEVVWAADGKLYGTTSSGGANGGGTVFQLVPPAAGEADWTLKTLKSFAGEAWHGPVGGLALASNGSLYGSTYSGGLYDQGRLFLLTPPVTGQTEWGYQTLVDFDGANGGNPEASLTWGPDGNLYGTTFWGGKIGQGTIFKLKP